MRLQNPLENTYTKNRNQHDPKFKATIKHVKQKINKKKQNLKHQQKLIQKCKYTIQVQENAKKQKQSLEKPQ